MHTTRRTLVSLFALATLTSFTAWAEGDAPQAGMLSGSWASANKQFFGTAVDDYLMPAGAIARSRVWFTGGSGILTEVFFPTVDTPQVRDSQLLVTDGHGYFAQESALESQVEWVEEGVPLFRVTTRDPGGRFEVQKWVFTDPASDALVVHVVLHRHVDGLRFYWLHNPQINNTPMDDTAEVRDFAYPRAPDARPASGRALVAWDSGSPSPVAGGAPGGSSAVEPAAQAVLTSVGWREAGVGFVGANDGYTDLAQDFTMDFTYSQAVRGNVAATARLDLPETRGESAFDVVIGFARTPEQAVTVAASVLKRGSQASRARFSKSWRAYQQSVRALDAAGADGGKLFRRSVALLKSMEDKTFRGAFVASPTVPWGNHNSDSSTSATPRSKQVGGYHLVWPRDLYQMATAFLAIGDSRTAKASLDWLRKAQIQGPESEVGRWEFGWRKHSKSGSFYQNYWVNGEPYWTGLQMDEVAMPVVLAYRLWKSGALATERQGIAAYWPMVRGAADFIADFGPWSPQERWEETSGASPSTIAAEISSLWCASAIAREMGDLDRSRRYQETADAWAFKPGDNVESWTFTEKGVYGSGRYYTRVEGARSYDQIWDPNDDQSFFLANGGGLIREKAVVDAGFLELVRFGVRPALDPAVMDSVPVIDSQIRVDLPGVGPAFFRYTGDRYNYDDLTGEQTRGMLWPFFTGERGHYELERGREQGLSGAQLDAITRFYVQAMERMATDAGLLPEQVWDRGPRAGRPTGSATPLGWTHGEYLKLLRSRRDRQVFDRLVFAR